MQRLIREQPFIFPGKQIWSRILFFLPAKAPLTAVAGDITSAPGEFIDGQTAVVGTSAAFGHGSGKRQFLHLCFGQHGRLLALIPFSCDQSRTESSHDSGDIRTDDLAFGNLFQASQYRIIIECTALNDDMLSERRGIGYLDDLKQRVFDDGIGKSGGDIIHTGPFLLRLLHTGIHEYRTAGSKVDGIFGKKGCLCKILNREVQGSGKGLKEGTASGRACFVELYIVHRMIFDADAFHILAADIQDAVYIRIKKLRSIIMGNGLYLSFIQHKRRLHKRFSVAGGTGTDNMGIRGKLRIQVLQRFQCDMQGASIIMMIEGIEERTVFSHQCDLCRGGACVNAEITVSFIGSQVFFDYLCMAVARFKCFECFRAVK